MAVNITPQPASYFYQVDAGGRKAPVSTMEISGIFQPEFLGRVVAEKLDRTSLFAQIMAQGNEFTASTSQVTWKEEGNTYNRTVVNGNVVKRTGNDFTFDASALPPDPYNIDSNKPANAQWIVAKGMEFAVIDNTGVVNHGVITAVSADHKTITATPVAEGDAWTIGTTKLDVIFTSYNLDSCECPPCIGYKAYAPTYENTMTKDGECLEYCEEDLIEEGAGAYDRFEVDGEFMNVDQRLNDRQRVLTQRMDNTLLIGNRLTSAQSTSLDKPLGTKGVLAQLEGRALKIEGMLESWEDLIKVATYLQSQQIDSATIRCNNAQYAKLMSLVNLNPANVVNPFENNQDAMYYIGFKGLNVNGTTLIFQKWNALDSTSSNLAKKYNFIVIPEGKLTRIINGRRETVGYLNIVWFGGNGKVWKYLRGSKKNETNCDLDSVNYTSKFAPLVFEAKKWIIGQNVIGG